MPDANEMIESLAPNDSVNHPAHYTQGGIECIATALSVENDMVPPTINYETPDLEEGLDLDYVPNKARSHTVRAAISNNFGFGGHNSAIVIKKYEE